MFTCMKSDQLQLVGYTDLNYDGCIDSRKFTSGYIFPDCMKMMDLVEKPLQPRFKHSAESDTTRLSRFVSAPAETSLRPDSKDPLRNDRIGLGSELTRPIDRVTIRLRLTRSIRPSQL